MELAGDAVDLGLPLVVGFGVDQDRHRAQARLTGGEDAALAVDDAQCAVGAAGGADSGQNAALGNRPDELGVVGDDDVGADVLTDHQLGGVGEDQGRGRCGGGHGGVSPN